MLEGFIEDKTGVLIRIIRIIVKMFFIAIQDLNITYGGERGIRTLDTG